MRKLMENLADYTRILAQNAKRAATALRGVSGEQKTACLRRCIELLGEKESQLLLANQKDIDHAPEYGLTDASIDRLRLTPGRLTGMRQAIEEIIMLPEPIGEIIGSNRRPNGLLVTKVRVPLGVVFFIYESRPNVTIDAAALCLKSGNAVILRGGKEAFHSNLALHEILKTALSETGLPAEAVSFVETTDREAVGHFLKMDDLIDVTIPRGGKSLIQRVSAEASMPVIKHYDGICHVYIHTDADLSMAEAIAVNAKTQRPGVCNAAEAILIDEAIASEFVPQLVGKLIESGVEVRGCPQTCAISCEAIAASEDDFDTEFLALKVAMKVVSNIDAAISHIETHGSHHTDCIVTNNLAASQKFTTEVDSAAVMVNASTRFNDGGEFGLGAEIGISTDRFHARGPCGLNELTTYKYVAHGSGQIKR